MLLAVSGNLTQTHYSNDGILVSGMCSGETSIALLQTEHIVVAACLLKEFDLLTDKLKACQHLDQLYIVCLRDGLCHIRRNDCCHKSRVLRHSACRCLFTQNVLCDQHTGHISGEGNILSGLRVLCVHAETVCIGVGSQNNIRVLLLRKAECISKCLRVLGIGIIQCREVRIGLFLLGNHINVLEAQLGENSSHRKVTGSAERGIYNLDVLSHLLDDIGMNDLLFQLCHVLVVDFLADHLIEVSLDRRILIHGLTCMEILDCLDFVDNLGILGRCHLCAVLPVYLIAVVLGRVMACRNDNTCRAAQRAEREGKLRSRSE